ATARAWLRTHLDAGESLARVFAQAPSYALARHMQRLVAEIEATDGDVGVLRPVLFAIPLVLVAALDAQTAPVVLSGVLPDVVARRTHVRRVRDVRAGAVARAAAGDRSRCVAGAARAHAPCTQRGEPVVRRHRRSAAGADPRRGARRAGAPALHRRRSARTP